MIRRDTPSVYVQRPIATTFALNPNNFLNLTVPRHPHGFVTLAALFGSQDM